MDIQKHKVHRVSPGETNGREQKIFDYSGVQNMKVGARHCQRELRDNSLY